MDDRSQAGHAGFSRRAMVTAGAAGGRAAIATAAHAAWLAHGPIEMVAETLNLDPSVIAQFPRYRPDIVPA